MATIFRAPLITPAFKPRPTPSFDQPPNLLLSTLEDQDQFFGAPGQGPNYDYPAPPLRSRYPVELRTFIHPVNLNLIGQDQFFGDAGQGPFNYDWIIPRRSRPSIEFDHPRSIAIDVAVPFFQYDDPTPRAARPFTERTFLQSPVLLGQDQFFTSAGEGPFNYDFTISRRARPLPPFDDLRSIILDTQNPFTQTDYPLPVARRYPTELRTWLQSVNLQLLGQDQFFTDAGEGPLNIDFTIPRRSRPLPPFDDLRSIVLDTVQNPFIPIDFIIPRRFRPVLGFDDLRSIALDVFNPFVPVDTVIQLARRYPTELRTFLNPTSLELYGQDQFFGVPGQGPPFTDFTVTSRTRQILPSDVLPRPIVLDTVPVVTAAAPTKQFIGEVQSLGPSSILDSSMGVT